MPRKLRLEFSGACYHVLNRGNYRRNLFATDGAAESFERCLFEAVGRFGWPSNWRVGAERNTNAAKRARRGWQ